MQFLRLFFLAALVHWAAAISAGTAKNVLSIHNKYRAKHSAPALTWDSTLEKYAQSWANKCKFQHTDISIPWSFLDKSIIILPLIKSPYGENLGWNYGNWEGALAGWYSEGAKYDYSNPRYSSSTGHFTQIVWKSTTKLGCVIKKCPTGLNYVCLYASAGNVITPDYSYFKANVLQK